MSVTFQIEGERVDWEDERPQAVSRWLNVANGNARELLGALGLAADEADLYGRIPARELARGCARYLYRPMLVGEGDQLEVVIVGAHDAARPARRPFPNVVECARRADYLASRARDLLALATLAGDGAIVFA